MNKSETRRKIDEAERLVNIHGDNVATRQTRIVQSTKNLKVVHKWLSEYARRFETIKKEYEMANSAFEHAQTTFLEAKQKMERLKREIEEMERNQLFRKNTQQEVEDERTLAQLEKELTSERAKLTAVQNNLRVLNRQEAQEVAQQARRSVANDTATLGSRRKMT